MFIKLYFRDRHEAGRNFGPAGAPHYSRRFRSGAGAAASRVPVGFEVAQRAAMPIWTFSWCEARRAGHEEVANGR